jgi:hypothetical protein
MFSRRAIQHTTRATLIAVLFVLAWPVIGYAYGIFAAVPALHEICTMEGMKSASPAPGALDVPGVPGSPVVAQKPCVFCFSSVPVFADAHAPRVVMYVDRPVLDIAAPPDQVLPPDVAATQPLSPRAPPRAI